MEVLFKTIFGSQLYGTNTPSSDVDYKGVFLPNIKELILGNVKLDSSINESNKEDMSAKSGAGVVETEMYSLQKFIKHAMDGQTVAIDMLFSPRKFWVEHSLGWNEVYSVRDQFLSKKLNAFVGYCRTQAAKYGIKGSRLNSSEKFINLFKSVDQDVLVGDIVEQIMELVDGEHAQVHLDSELHKSYLDVCGKKFLFTSKIRYGLPTLEKFWENYGSRARMAATDDGVDFKAISHAFRAAYEVKELVETRDIKFPLKDRQFLLDVKTHQYKYIDIAPRLEDLVDEVGVLVANSDLPDKPKVNHEELVLNFYNWIWV